MPGWLSVPLVLTSNSWENGKNELSHQDTSMAECMLGESSDTSRVFFPPDYNAATFLMGEVYMTHGQIWTMVVSKQPAPIIFNWKECSQLWKQGGLLLAQGYKPEAASLALIAIGTYQLLEILKASKRLAMKKIAHSVVYIQEPGKLREPRNDGELRHGAPDKTLEHIIPAQIKEILLVTHTRPEPMVGTLSRLLQGKRYKALGFINEGGTLDSEGMLFVNRCSFAHILEQAASLLNIKPEKLLNKAEMEALCGKRSPDGIIRGIK